MEKNVGAFTSHYLRLGANEMAGQRIDEMVHTVSPLGSASPSLTLPPRSKFSVVH